MESNSWEKVVDEYLVLQRYDLSIEDFKKLGSLIPYPPTPEMKDMHMFPPHTGMKKDLTEISARSLVLGRRIELRLQD